MKNNYEKESLKTEKDKTLKNFIRRGKNSKASLSDLRKQVDKHQKQKAKKID